MDGFVELQQIDTVVISTPIAEPLHWARGENGWYNVGLLVRAPSLTEMSKVIAELVVYKTLVEIKLKNNAQALTLLTDHHAPQWHIFPITGETEFVIGRPKDEHPSIWWLSF